ncbi:MAG TPA: hypothetical protein VF787_12095, partial [Thermoanaerobaculia bacterium]
QEVLARNALLQKNIAKAQTAISRASTLTAKSITIGLLASIRATQARVELARGTGSFAWKLAQEAVAKGKASHILATELDARLVAADVDAQLGRSSVAAERSAVAEIAKKHGLLLLARKASRR